MDNIQKEIVLWLNSVVIGLNLCPFAAKPARENRVRFFISHAKTEEELLTDLSTEMELLDKTPAIEVETTLIIIPDFLRDFYSYNQFLAWAGSHIKRNGWQGVYQLASFHPGYCFTGADEDDVENLTNRSPYPILHIIREASLSAALQYVDNVEDIPRRNKARVELLTDVEKQNLFYYLFR